MADELTTWVPLTDDQGRQLGLRLGLHFETLGGRVECVALELRSEPTRGLRALDVRAIKLETHIRDAVERNPKLKAELAKATGGALGARGKYDRAHYERVASIYANAVLEGRSPTQTVQAELGISYPAAASQIARARSMALLPPQRSIAERLALRPGTHEWEHLCAVERTDPAAARAVLISEAETAERSARDAENEVPKTGFSDDQRALARELRALANKIAPARARTTKRKEKP